MTCCPIWYDAISFYYDHQETMDAEITEHTTEAWQERLRQRMGYDAFARLTRGWAEHDREPIRKVVGHGLPIVLLGWLDRTEHA